LFQRLKLEYDEQLSKFTFHFYSRPYTVEVLLGCTVFPIVSTLNNLNSNIMPTAAGLPVSPWVGSLYNLACLTLTLLHAHVRSAGAYTRPFVSSMQAFFGRLGN
jgi:hypothetical protein